VNSRLADAEQIRASKHGERLRQPNFHRGTTEQGKSLNVSILNIFCNSANLHSGSIPVLNRQVHSGLDLIKNHVLSGF
jgi:hypothetical protein